MHHPEAKTWVEISKGALVANAKTFKRRLGAETALMAVVKSNAYGHGLREVSRTLSGHADWFGVDNVDEAATLRASGIRAPILILGFTPSWRMVEAVRFGARITVSTLDQLRAARNAARKARKKAVVHVKVETGTTRQGASLKELPLLTELLAGSKNLVFEGLSTHYANIEDTRDRDYAAGQLETFRNAVEMLEARKAKPPILHTACTAAAALYPDTYFNLARVGIGLYGLWPSKEAREAADDKDLGMELAPVLAWKTVIAQVKDVRRGTPIGYDLTERMPRDGKVAVLGVGYWDGYDRGFSSKSHAIVRGVRCKVLGRICMNMCMIDVTHVPGVRAEDEVTLLGRTGSVAVTAEELGETAGTINYEIVTRINPSIPRVLK